MRTHKFCDPGMPNMTVMMRPVFPYRPIYDLYKNWVGVKRVVGISCLLEPNSERNLELNEYGIVYYRTALCPDENRLTIDENRLTIYVYDFIEGIYGALHPAKEFYQACDTLGILR